LRQSRVDFNVTPTEGFYFILDFAPRSGLDAAAKSSRPRRGRLPRYQRLVWSGLDADFAD